MNCIYCNNQIKLEDLNPLYELYTPYHGNPYGWCRNHHDVLVYFKWQNNCMTNNKNIPTTLLEKMITEPQNDPHLPFKGIYQNLIKKYHPIPK